MNCDTIHRRLLSLERPDQPPADLRGHLASCPACRAWHKRLVEMEARVAQMTVPPPQRKTAFLDSLRQPAPTPSLLSFPPQPRVQQPAPRERSRDKIDIAGTLKLPLEFLKGLPSRVKIAIAVAGAAALLLIAIGVASWPRDKAPAGELFARIPSPLSPLEQRLKADARWAKAKTPQQRLEVLGDLADETHAKAEKMARANDLKDINQEVALYREIIDKTSKEAKEVAAKERKKVLQPLADRLARAESQARLLAEQKEMEKSSAAAPLRDMVAIAHEGNQQIRALIQEAAA